MSSLSKTRENDDKVAGSWLALADWQFLLYLQHLRVHSIGLLSDIGQIFSVSPRPRRDRDDPVYAWGVMLLAAAHGLCVALDFRRLLGLIAKSLPRASSSRRFAPPTCFSFARDWLLLRRTRSSGPS